MDHPDITESNFMEHFIGPKRINEGRVVEFVIYMCESFQDYSLGRFLWLLWFNFSLSKGN